MREQMIEMTTNVPIHSGVAPLPGGQSTDAPSTVDVAKEQAATVRHGAADAGQHVADVAKNQAQSVVAEAGSQTADLLRQARSELTDQANAQQQRVARSLHALGDELQSMAQRSEQPGVATDLARQASSKTHDMASWLDSREPGQLVQELRAFARQRPGTFLLAAAGAGLLAGRLTRGVKDASSTDGSGSDHRAMGNLTPTAAVPAAPGPTPKPVAPPQRAPEYGLGGEGL
jgi:cell division septum initiation protein DivIVA